MAISSVADSPFIAGASARFAQAKTVALKVPVRYYRAALIALSAFWACHTVASLFWLMLPPPVLPVQQVAPSSATFDLAGRAKVDIEPIQALNLFGDINAEPVASNNTETTPDEQLEDTKLNVELQGVIAANDPEFSWAIIGRTENQKLYKIGDELDDAPGVKVAQIHDIRIVLDNRGNLEQLWLYGEDGKNFAKTRAAPRAAEPEPTQAAVIRQEQIQQARNIGDVVRFMVATENGRMIGYKVRPGRQRELFDQVGLRTDDIVVSVNGIEVNEPQKVREVYQALKTATEANLQVLRDGTTHAIQITMSSEG